MAIPQEALPFQYDVDTLYRLLPAIYRIRDADAGEPLKALMQVIAEQMVGLEENLAQLYDDQFIETCAEWVVPYIGDLIGVRGIYQVADQVISSRAEVANTIAYRRRKGTAAVLEQLARDVTGWNARVVEFFQLLATTQYMNHIRPTNLAWPDLRDGRALVALQTPFTSTARTVDVRRIDSSQRDSRGLYNIPNIGLFLWRIDAYPLTDSPAFQVDGTRFTFDPLGRSLPIFNDPVTEDEITHLAEPINVPMPIGRRMLKDHLADYYSKDKNASICIDTGADPFNLTQVAVCDLSDLPDGSWAHTPPDKPVAIDPVLGRIVFQADQATPPLVTYHYGFSAAMGGGEYPRQGTFDPDLTTVAPVVSPASIQVALNGLADDGVIEIQDSKRYAETLALTAAAGQRMELRAKDEARPLIKLSGDMTITGAAEAEVTLNGLLIDGGAIRVSGDLQRLTLRHCTLVPRAGPSLVIDSTSVIVRIESCIVGAIQALDGAEVVIENSIVDALADDAEAYAALGGASPAGPLTVTNSTLIGKVATIELVLASNVIFLAGTRPGDMLAPVHSDRTQEGCIRFSYVPLDARVPRRHHCQPQATVDKLRVRPQFTSLRYGEPGYGQLSGHCAVEIRTGADDEAEMGAFHDLYQPQREINLRLRLEEYLRFGLEAGIFYAS